FERKSSHEKFLSRYREQLQKRGIAPPFRLYILARVGVSQYDFDKKGFPLRFGMNPGDFEGRLHIPCFRGSRVNEAPITLPIAYKLPTIWPLPEAKAESIVKTLKKSSRVYSAYALLEV